MAERNVIIAGIYYGQDSWKAKLCIRGRKMLYDFCDDYHVEYNRCGKLIAAQDHQVRDIQSL